MTPMKAFLGKDAAADSEGHLQRQGRFLALTCSRKGQILPKTSYRRMPIPLFQVQL